MEILENRSHDVADRLQAAVSLVKEGGDSQDQEWIQRIEKCREQMLANLDPLVDGTLGEAGIYDSGNKTISQACSVSKKGRDAFFLYSLVRSLDSRHVLELGTNVGISSSYLAAGLMQNGHGGTLVTLESSRYRQRQAIRLHEELGLDNSVSYVQGLFADTLETVLETQPPFDLVFVDGHHLYQPTLDYTEQILAHVSAGTVLLFDDIRWSEGMEQVWARLQEDSRFGFVLDCTRVGVCVVGDLDGSPRQVSGPVKLT